MDNKWNSELEEPNKIRIEERKSEKDKTDLDILRDEMKKEKEKNKEK